MPASDTTPEIEAMQIKIIRSMTVEQRLLLALDMSLMVREFRKAGIRDQHPDWSEEEVMREIHREAFLPESLPAWVR
jgi:hypothetical protein